MQIVRCVRNIEEGDPGGLGGDRFELSAMKGRFLASHRSRVISLLDKNEARYAKR